MRLSMTESRSCSHAPIRVRAVSHPLRRISEATARFPRTGAARFPASGMLPRSMSGLPLDLNGVTTIAAQPPDGQEWISMAAERSRRLVDGESCSEGASSPRCIIRRLERWAISGQLQP